MVLHGLPWHAYSHDYLLSMLQYMFEKVYKASTKSQNKRWLQRRLAEGELWITMPPMTMLHKFSNPNIYLPFLQLFVWNPLNISPCPIRNPAVNQSKLLLQPTPAAPVPPSRLPAILPLLNFCPLGNQHVFQSSGMTTLHYYWSIDYEK